MRDGNVVAVKATTHNRTTARRAARARAADRGSSERRRRWLAFGLVGAVSLGLLSLAVGLRPPLKPAQQENPSLPVLATVPAAVQPQSSGFNLPSQGPPIEPVPNPTVPGVYVPTAPVPPNPGIPLPSVPGLGAIH